MIYLLSLLHIGNIVEAILPRTICFSKLDGARSRFRSSSHAGCQLTGALALANHFNLSSQSQSDVSPR